MLAADPGEVTPGFQVAVGSGSSQAGPSTQAQQEVSQPEELEEVLIAQLNIKVVGCQHYHGTAHEGEYVNLIREPRNPYDRNAIRVDNLAGVQVGHVPRDFAVGLAPIFDGAEQKGLSVEAAITNKGNKWNLPMQLTIYGPPEGEAQAFVERHFRDMGAGWLPPKAPKVQAAPSAVVSRRVQTMAVHSQEDLDKLFDKLDSNDTKGRAVPHIPHLLTKLHGYQEQGVAWMLEREKAPDGGELPPFWTKATEVMGGQKQSVYFNTITSSSTATRPVSVRGGILADDMGMGKSVQVLSLWLAHPPDLTTAQQASAHSPPAPKVAKFQNLSKKELQKACRDRGLATTGTKDVLTQRLLQPASEDVVDLTGDTSSGELAAVVRTDLPRCTLLVCPSSVMSNWETQVEQHVAVSAAGLKVYTYHGPDRNRDPDFLASQDLVITSYSILTQDNVGDTPVKGKRKHNEGGVKEVAWHRVVLDEAHTIRNRTTKLFKAAMALKAAHKWAVTGTPLQNRVEDVQSLLEFLGSSPLNDAAIFRRAIARPLRVGATAALTKLALIFKAICLRRGKDVLPVAARLPPKTVEIHSVKLDAKQREDYDVLYQSLKRTVDSVGFDESAGGAVLLSNYTAVLEGLLRLRQVCCCPTMVPPERIAAARRMLEVLGKHREDTQGAAEITQAQAQSLFAKLKQAMTEVANEETDHECAVCLEALTDAGARILTVCGHTFCDACITRIAKDASMSSRCPLCRQQYIPANIMSLQQLAANDKAAKDKAVQAEQNVPAAAADEQAPAAPPKVRAMMEKLATHLQADSAAKAVVFSQFTSFLDVIGKSLRAEGIVYERLDGSMSADRRSRAIKAFEKANADGGPTVFLISTKAGGVGLNLTCANLVFMMDLWWNAASEDQAMDRVHRLGQTRPVTVVRYVVEASLEERLLAMQEQKAALGKSVLKEQSAEEARRMRLGELQDLFA